MCITFMSSLCRGQKKGMDLLELELQAIMNNHAFAEESNLGPLKDQQML